MKFIFSLAAVLLLALIFLLVFRRSSTRTERSIPQDSVLLAYPLRHGGWVQIRREVSGLQPTHEERARRVIEELTLPDSDPAVFPPLPETFPLRTAYLDGSRLYLDFSRDAVAGLSGGTEEEIILLESLKRTLAWNLPNVDHLQILIDGQPRRTLGAAGEDAGHIDIWTPIALAK